MESKIVALQKELEEYLTANRFALDSVEIFQAIWLYPDVRDLMHHILANTYFNILHQPGRDFVDEYFKRLTAFTTFPSLEQVKTMMLGLRERFQTEDLKRIYRKQVRQFELKTTHRVTPFNHFRGHVLDVGADDNKLGQLLLEQCQSVTEVTGIDIERRDTVIESERLKFLVQSQPTAIPLPDKSVDTIVDRYVFHHMTWEQQNAILGEIRRVSRPGAHVIVYEDTWSHQLSPEILNDKGAHQRMLDLRDPRKIRLFHAAMDTFSQGIKDKHQPFAYTFRTVEDWQTFFEQFGFQTNAIRYFGIPLYFSLHQASFGILIFEMPED